MIVPTKTEARNSCFRAKINPGYLVRIIRAVLVGGTLIRLGVRALSFMVQYQLKLKLTPRQDRQLNHWLFHLAAVWNWAIRKIEQDGRDGVYYAPKGFHGLLAGHGNRLAIPSHVLQGTLAIAHQSWSRCFKELARKPRFKGRRNKLSSIAFPDPLRLWPNSRVGVLGVGRVRYHKQEIPEGKIKCGRIIKRASGWYLCLFIDAEPNPIPAIASGQVGIDPGFKSLLTLSTGEKVAHPRELEISALRLAQAQRGNGSRLTSRIQERIANQRKDRNHKLSRHLISENQLITFSVDSHKNIAKKFGKSVASSSHGQLRSMLAYKCRAGGREYIEVPSRNSTKTCSACGALSGPSGWAGLKVRLWTCAQCGAEHDRDVNAAINTLNVGLGMSLELSARAV